MSHPAIDYTMLEESTGNFSASRNVYDWYQTNTHVNINIMIKNLTEADVKVRLIDETLDVSCNLADGSEFKLHFNLFKSIFVNESSWTVTPSKLEIKLKKMDRKRWQSLEVIPDKSHKRLHSPPSFLMASPSATAAVSSPKRFMTAASAGQSQSPNTFLTICRLHDSDICFWSYARTACPSFPDPSIVSLCTRPSLSLSSHTEPQITHRTVTTTCRKES